MAEISCLSREIKDEIRSTKTVEKMLEATWTAVTDLQDAQTQGGLLNALKSKGEKSILESQQA